MDKMPESIFMNVNVNLISPYATGTYGFNYDFASE